MIKLRVKEAAKEKKMSQARLSRLSGVDAGTIREIFHDPARNITMETLNRLANALQVDAKELFHYTPDPVYILNPKDKPD